MFYRDEPSCLDHKVMLSVEGDILDPEALAKDVGSSSRRPLARRTGNSSQPRRLRCPLRSPLLVPRIVSGGDRLACPRTRGGDRPGRTGRPFLDTADCRVAMSDSRSETTRLVPADDILDKYGSRTRPTCRRVTHATVRYPHPALPLPLSPPPAYIRGHRSRRLPAQPDRPRQLRVGSVCRCSSSEADGASGRAWLAR